MHFDSIVSIYCVNVLLFVPLFIQHNVKLILYHKPGIDGTSLCASCDVELISNDKSNNYSSRNMEEDASSNYSSMRVDEGATSSSSPLSLKALASFINQAVIYKQHENLKSLESSRFLDCKVEFMSSALELLHHTAQCDINSLNKNDNDDVKCEKNESKMGAKVEDVEAIFNQEQPFPVKRPKNVSGKSNAFKYVGKTGVLYLSSCTLVSSNSVKSIDTFKLSCSFVATGHPQWSVGIVEDSATTIGKIVLRNDIEGRRERELSTVSMHGRKITVIVDPNKLLVIFIMNGKIIHKVGIDKKSFPVKIGIEGHQGTHLHLKTRNCKETAIAKDDSPKPIIDVFLDLDGTNRFVQDALQKCN